MEQVRDGVMAFYRATALAIDGRKRWLIQTSGDRAQRVSLD